MRFRTLTYIRRGDVVYLSLNRPRAFNRVNLSMAQEIHHACQYLREEQGLRVVVLSGNGAHFSSGGDVPSMARSLKGGYTPRQWLELHRPASSLAALPFPLVAAINGDALDHGLELALACDLRIAAQGTRLGLSQLRRGVLPWDGGTQCLPRLVGRARALDMLLTGRVLEAQEALTFGLVNMVVAPEELMDTVEELCRSIASAGPIAARYTKEAVHKGMDMTLEQGLGLEADLNILLQSTADRAEGIRSFLEKREPQFNGE